MKINSQELLVVNSKKMKMSALNNQTAPVVEPQESKPDSTLNALALQGQNNVAFQGSMLNATKKFALGAMMALMTAGPVLTTTSCTDINQEVSVVLDQSLIQKLLDAIKEGDETQNELLTLILAELQKGNEISQEMKQLLFEVLAVTKQLNENDQEAKALMNEVLGVIYEFMSQEKAMDEATQAFLSTLTKQVAKLDQNDKVGLALIQKIWERIQNYMQSEQEMDKRELLLLQSILENIQNFNADTKELLLNVIDNFDNLGAEAMALLDKIYLALDKNNVISSQNQELLGQIVAGLAILDKNDKEGFDLLNKIWAKIEQAIADNQAIDEKEIALLHAILDNIQNFNADTKDLFAKLMNKIDSVDANVIKALKIIIEKMDNIKGTDSEKMLNQILDAINKNNEISADNNKLLSVIITQLAGLNENDEKGFELINKIWAQLQEAIKYNEALDGKTHALLLAILENIQGLGDSGKAALDKILDAINKNSEIAQGTQDLVKELLGKVDKLGDKADKIIETIANIGVGEKVDLSKIESMLADLLAQEKANGQIFNNLDAKLALIEVSLEALKKHEMASDPAVLKKLQEILDKIPAGCDCTHESLDITVIIEKLQEIIDKMDDPNNEGILGDLGDLDNILG